MRKLFATKVATKKRIKGYRLLIHVEILSMIATKNATKNISTCAARLIMVQKQNEQVLNEELIF